MLRNVSYNNPETIREINTLVGKPYSFFQRLKKGGIGSPKMVVVGSSPEINALLTVDNRTHFTNIEMRPNGILIGFRSRLESYAFVIPFYKLVIYKAEREVYSIYSDTGFVKISPCTYDRPIHSFMKKLILAKNQQVSNSIEDA
ncbi:MAG: hypothetical protein K0U54_08070 [Bacteroidetes bacterium]|nr:hypothetical protein [Bacteroidota bacterium]